MQSPARTYCRGHLDQRLDLALAKVRNPNGLDLVGLGQLLHRLPRIDKTRLAVDHPAISIAWESVWSTLEGARVVHQQQVDIRGIQVAERVV